MKKLILLLGLLAGSWMAWAEQPLTKADVRQTMRRVADWQIAHIGASPHGELNWVNATFYLGLSRWAEIAEEVNGDDTYYKWLRRLGARNYWQVDQRMYHADDVCIAQTYLDLYRKYRDEAMWIPTLARTEWVMAHPSSGSFALDYADARTLERWTWCDALFMAPPVYARLYALTGDKSYLRFMDKEYKETYQHLFDKEAHLFYRDHRYIGQKEANGEKVFWSRGNGWVVGGLVEILRVLPEEDKKYRPFYEQLFVELCTRILELQQADGFWRASLLDPDSYPSPETSGTGFFLYGFAYGINQGLLPRDKFMPALEKGWRAMCSVVDEDGRLGFVQPVGADPRSVSREMTESYGPGAFLLAGSEIYPMASDELAFHTISPERVREIASMLPDKPEGVGVTYKDRTFWGQIAALPEAQALLEEANRNLAEGMPPFVDSLYLHLNKTGVRLPGENMMNARYYYVFRLALAECIENKGRFTKAIRKGIEELCAQKPWSIPAHDRNLNNYYGRDYYVDLVVATSGNSLAQCLYLLDDKLPAETRALAMSAFREKVFRPVVRCLEETEPFFWFTVTNNWNSVCLAGVTGAALALLPDKEERAYFVAMAEKYQAYGMKGYADDGYCSEGVGYYNYGFAAYLLLREEVCRATQGQIDFFRLPKFVHLAQYGKNIQILNGVCPAYSDCRIGMTPASFVTDYCARALGLEASPVRYRVPAMTDNFSLHLIYLFPAPAWTIDMTPEMTEALKESSDPLHTLYPLAEIFLARPAEGTACRMGISFKAGHNGESHNHNDVGSYCVVVGQETMAGDMGGPFSYPGDFFDSDAYKYPIKNSFGHPLPVVDGHLQQEGKRAKGRILNLETGSVVDSARIDLAAAYPQVDALQKLTRTFLYDRTGKGSFLVADQFSAQQPITFETALTTRAAWKLLSDTQLELTSGEETLRVQIEASAPVRFSADTIEVNCPPYTRIGIALKGKAKEGFIRLLLLPRE